jgi:hypothetical protein
MTAIELDHDDLDRIERVARARCEGSAWERAEGQQTVALVTEVRTLWKLAGDQNTLNERLMAEVQRQDARVEELEAALDLALGHMRHEDDCTWTVGLRRGEGLSQGGPGVVCNCGNRDAVRRVSELMRNV